MVLRDILVATDALKDACDMLEMIDFHTPTEPRDDADAEVWREYALSVADKLAEAEKDIMRAVQCIKD